MKKLLSLLLTLALATSAFAECAFYMDDFVVNRDQIGNNTEITLPIKATFSGRLNGWDLLISYPEHLIPTYIEPGFSLVWIKEFWKHLKVFFSEYFILSVPKHQ